MLRYICITVLLLSVLSGAFAQPDPANLPASDSLMMPLFMLSTLDQMPMLTTSTPNALYSLRHGVLVKYDATTLRQQGILELFGPLGVWDKNRLANKDDGMMMLLARARHMLPPAIAVNENDLFITIGGQLFCVDGEKLQLKYSVQVIEPDPLLAIARGLELGAAISSKAARLFMSCQLKMNGKFLQVIYGDEIRFVNVEDGKITARSTAPAALSANLIPPLTEGPFAEKPEATEPVEGKTYMTIGVVTHHPEVNDGFWTVKEYDGKEFVLLNGAGSRQTGVPRIEGVRVLLRGTYTKEHAGLPNYGKGFLEVNGFLLLSTDEVAKE